MGDAPLSSKAGMPSMASPTTFMTLPRICAPTGMVMGFPVETTFMPRCSPSVLSMAMVRTVSSPMCCCTSTINVLPPGRGFSGVVYARKVGVLFFFAVFEMNVHHRADNLRYVS